MNDNNNLQIVEAPQTPTMSSNRGRSGKKDLGKQGKHIIANVYNFLQSLADDPKKVEMLNFKRVQELTAEACGVSRATVQGLSLIHI